MQQPRWPFQPHAVRVNKPKSNLHYTTPKRVTSVEAHLRCFAPGQHTSEETVASHWRHRADLTGPGIESQTSRTDSLRLTTELTSRLWTG